MIFFNRFKIDFVLNQQDYILRKLIALCPEGLLDCEENF
jgi:hypothetical protein